MSEPTDIHALLERGARDDIAIAAPEREPLTYGGLREQVGRTGDALASAQASGRRPGGDRAPQRAGDGGGLPRRGRARHGGAAQPRLPGGRVRLLPRRPARQGTDPEGRGGEPGHRGSSACGRPDHRPHARARCGCRLLHPRHPVRHGQAGQWRRCGRCGAGAPHLGHHIPAQDRAADGRQPLRVGAQYRRLDLAPPRRPLPQHHAALPHPRADGGRDGLAPRGRLCDLHAGLQRAPRLRVARRDGAHLAHRRAHHAPGDPRARAAQQGDHRASQAPSCCVRPLPRCRRR